MMSGGVISASVLIGAGNAWTAVAAVEPAKSATNPFDFITPFLNIGLVGVLLLMFVLRKGIVPEWVLKQTEERHREELARKDADIEELKKTVAEGTKLYNDQVVPAFTRSIDVNREYVELLRRQAEGAQTRQAAPRRRPTGG